MQREEAQQARIASLNDDTAYTVAVSHFVAAQAVKALGDAITIRPGSVLVRDVLIEYIRDNGITISGE